MRMVAAVQDRGPGGDGTLSRPVYDVPHAVRPWGWRVSAYLWTKSIAAGALLVAALMGSAWWGGLRTTIAPAISLTFLLLTLLLLVVDLKRPDRFGTSSSSPTGARGWCGGRGSSWPSAAGGWWLLDGLRGARPPLCLTFLAARSPPAGAGYSAFLFGQAEGRDFWQSPLCCRICCRRAGRRLRRALLLAAARRRRGPGVAEWPRTVVPVARCRERSLLSGAHGAPTGGRARPAARLLTRAVRRASGAASCCAAPRAHVSCSRAPSVPCGSGPAAGSPSAASGCGRTLGEAGQSIPLLVGESMTPSSLEPLHPAAREMPPPAPAAYPPVERWADWEEYDPSPGRTRSSAATRSSPRSASTARRGAGC